MPEPEADQISITVCGDGGCGKSSITLRLVRSDWTDDYDPTIEDSYSVTRVVDGRTCQLSLTDTAGQEEYRGLWASSNLSSDAFLLVYDITNYNSLTHLDHFLDLIDMEADRRMDANVRAGRGKSRGFGMGTSSSLPSLTMPVKIIAGNKCDLAERRQVRSVDGLEYARKHGCGFMETSARNMVNVEETFALLVRRVIDQRRLLEPGPYSRKKSSSSLRVFTQSNSSYSGLPMSVIGGHPADEKTSAAAAAAATAVLGVDRNNDNNNVNPTTNGETEAARLLHQQLYHRHNDAPSSLDDDEAGGDVPLGRAKTTNNVQGHGGTTTNGGGGGGGRAAAAGAAAATGDGSGGAGGGWARFWAKLKCW